MLAESALIEVVDVLAHPAALGRTDWTGVTTVLVDAVDERRVDDQFAGVSVVEHVRRHTKPAATSIVVMTDHFYDDALRRRMSEARADAFHHRAELADADTLRDIILRPSSARRRVPPARTPDGELAYGVSGSTRVNRAVAFALAHDLRDQLAHRTQPRSRYWMRLRRDFNAEARLFPLTVDGCEPDRNQSLPSLPQIARFLTWATTIKRPAR